MSDASPTRSDIISLSFSNLGGPQIVAGVLRRQRQARATRIVCISNLGEYYLAKLRYHDAARRVQQRSLRSIRCIDASPHFSMRVVEIYDDGPFSASWCWIQEGVRADLRMA